jgi:hypothetical protein
MMSQTSTTWPVGGTDRLRFDTSFSTSDRGGVVKPFTAISGFVLSSNGAEVLKATIDAYIGDTLCGQTSLPPVATLTSNAFRLLVVGPASIPGCSENGIIHFKVDGAPVGGAAVNTLRGSGDGGIDLDLQEGAAPGASAPPQPRSAFSLVAHALLSAQ